MFVYTQIEVQFASLKDSNEALFSVFGRTVHFVELLYERHVFHLRFYGCVLRQVRANVLYLNCLRSNVLNII